MKLKLNETTAARRRIPFYAVQTDGVTPMTGTSFAGGEIIVCKNGATPANFAGTVTEVSSVLFAGLHYYEAAAAELDTVGFLALKFAETGSRLLVEAVQVVSYDPYDTVRLGLTSLPNAAAEAAGGLYTRGTGAGQINQAENGQIDAKIVTITNALITAATIAQEAFTNSKFATASIGPLQIKQETLIASKFGTGSFGAIQFQQETLTAAKFATGSFTAVNFAEPVVKLFASGNMEYVIEGTETFIKTLRLSRAVLYGNASGLEGTGMGFRDLADSKDRLIATYVSGTRTISAIDGT